MAWEIFERKIRKRGSPAITLNKLGRISLNKTATAVLEKEAVELVLLLWDADKHQIGIRATTKKGDPRAYRLAFGQKGNGAGFSAKTFMDYIGYDFSESRSFPARWEEAESTFVAEIPEEHLRGSQKQPLFSVAGQGTRKSKGA